MTRRLQRPSEQVAIERVPVLLLMCGIAGMIGYHGRPADRVVVDRMAASLFHRGPDDGASYIGDSVGLGFRRLSILDLSAAAQQPMVSRDRQLVLVFNGEIFNYVELRAELERLGHTFESTGDTEVLLHAYRQWGRHCLERLNGMWAFVVYDVANRRVFGSRDRFGIKPLYYYRHADVCLFASEIKALLASGLYPYSPDWHTIADFLVRNRLDETSSTFYSEIRQVEPGTAFEWDLDGQNRTWRYWSIDDARHEAPQDPIAAFAELFEDAVRLHMRSDVPVGVCLSGGLDSTSIICATARGWNESSQPLMAFSFNAAEFDESRYIEDTIGYTGADLHRLDVDPKRLWDNLPTVLALHDEPVQSMTPLVGFELMRLAAQSGVKVILNGQGSDEVLAGYASFFRPYWCSLVKDGRLRAAWHQMTAHTATHGGRPEALALKALKDVTQGAIRGVGAYQHAVQWKRRREATRERWFTQELADTLQPEPPVSDWSLHSRLKRAVEVAPLPLFLRVEDRNSMAHSIEARLPFLDHRLVSLAFSMSAEWKLHGPWNKYVLRQAMRARIPESVRTRADKMGFPVPERTWLAGTLHGQVRDLLWSQEARERGIYDLVEVQRDLELHRQGKTDVSTKLFRLVQTETWLKLGARGDAGSNAPTLSSRLSQPTEHSRSGSRAAGISVRSQVVSASATTAPDGQALR